MEATLSKTIFSSLAKKELGDDSQTVDDDALEEYLRGTNKKEENKKVESKKDSKKEEREVRSIVVEKREGQYTKEQLLALFSGAAPSVPTEFTQIEGVTLEEPTRPINSSEVQLKEFDTSIRKYDYTICPVRATPMGGRGRGRGRGRGDRGGRGRGRGEGRGRGRGSDWGRPQEQEEEPEASSESEEEEEEEDDDPESANLRWWYKDPNGKVQGPYPSDTMNEWLKKGVYFKPNLPVKFSVTALSEDIDFVPLRDISVLGNPFQRGKSHTNAKQFWRSGQALAFVQGGATSIVSKPAPGLGAESPSSSTAADKTTEGGESSTQAKPKSTTEETKTTKPGDETSAGVSTQTGGSAEVTKKAKVSGNSKENKKQGAAGGAKQKQGGANNKSGQNNKQGKNQGKAASKPAAPKFGTGVEGMDVGVVISNPDQKRDVNNPWGPKPKVEDKPSTSTAAPAEKKQDNAAKTVPKQEQNQQQNKPQQNQQQNKSQQQQKSGDGNKQQKQGKAAANTSADVVPGGGSWASKVAGTPAPTQEKKTLAEIQKEELVEQQKRNKETAEIQREKARDARQAAIRENTPAWGGAASSAKETTSLKDIQSAQSEQVRRQQSAQQAKKSEATVTPAISGWGSPTGTSAPVSFTQILQEQSSSGKPAKASNNTQEQQGQKGGNNNNNKANNNNNNNNNNKGGNNNNKGNNNKGAKSAPVVGVWGAVGGTAAPSLKEIQQQEKNSAQNKAPSNSGSTSGNQQTAQQAKAAPGEGGESRDNDDDGIWSIPADKDKEKNMEEFPSLSGGNKKGGRGGGNTQGNKQGGNAGQGRGRGAGKKKAKGQKLDTNFTTK